jgi:hypothetical protein
MLLENVDSQIKKSLNEEQIKIINEFEKNISLIFEFDEYNINGRLVDLFTDVYKSTQYNLSNIPEINLEKYSYEYGLFARKIVDSNIFKEKVFDFIKNLIFKSRYNKFCKIMDIFCKKYEILFTI